MTLVEYTHIPINESKEPLVDLAEQGLIVDSMYSNRGLAPDSKLFARKSVADKLLAAQAKLNGYRFKIWDAYRSRDVQNNIYQQYWKELSAEHPEWDEEKLKLEVGKFVSPPYDTSRIPPHVTGGAIDLTLVDQDGKELDMGTGFDFFGPEASSSYKCSELIMENRKLLQEALLAEGFTLDQDEWWHFDYGNQIWALKANESFAIYGEMESPL